MMHQQQMLSANNATWCLTSPRVFGLSRPARLFDYLFPCAILFLSPRPPSPDGHGSPSLALPDLFLAYLAASVAHDISFRRISQPSELSISLSVTFQSTTRMPVVENLFRRLLFRRSICRLSVRSGESVLHTSV